MTISSDNPVNIDDVLENRSYSGPDKAYGSNHSTLTNQSTRSRSSVSTLTNQKSKKDSLSRYSDTSTASSKRGRDSQQNQFIKAPVEILINDGEGSIDTLSIGSSSPGPYMTLNQSKLDMINKTKRSMNRRQPSESEEEDIDDDHAQSFEINSEPEDNSDFYVSPLDKVLDEEDSSSDYVSIFFCVIHETLFCL